MDSGELGTAIRRRRVALGFTQAQLGDAVGKTDKTIRHWEAGRNGAMDNLEILERVLGVLEGTPPATEPSKREVLNLLRIAATALDDAREMLHALE